jgi:4-alpha-glucanotransferase
MSSEQNARRAGLMVPLFSIPSRRSWGIGEIADLEPVLAWLDAAGQRLLQLLPITETRPGDSSPYGSLSAMAIDPQYISIASLEDFAAGGGESRLSPGARAALDRARAAPAIDYRTVGEVKQVALRMAFDRFEATEWTGHSVRARAFRAFMTDHGWWLDDYALFRALHARYDERPWTEWPEGIRARWPDAVERERAVLSREVLYRKYLQWVAEEQWAAVRARAGRVRLFGDLPFVVSSDSADVWARQHEFDLEGSVGVPPDAFSASGQDWGLPAYRWDVVRAGDFDWLRQRARRIADLFDGCRVDHVVGFYRTFVRPPGEREGRFFPGDEPAQLALGEQVLALLAAAGIEIVAEDLGTVPDFVRQSLARLAIPGYKVFRWERYWDLQGQPFRDPRDYPEVAVATSGTHDTEPMVLWWAAADVDERWAVLQIPSLRERLSDEDVSTGLTATTLPQTLRAMLLEALYASRANLLILPFQDVFGWSDRINQPATVGEQNWTWRLPWPSDRLPAEPQAVEVARQLRAWSALHGR